MKKIETTYFQSFSPQTTTQQNIATKKIKPRNSQKLFLELLKLKNKTRKCRKLEILVSKHFIIKTKN